MVGLFGYWVFFSNDKVDCSVLDVVVLWLVVSIVLVVFLVCLVVKFRLIRVLIMGLCIVWLLVESVLLVVVILILLCSFNIMCLVFCLLILGIWVRVVMLLLVSICCSVGVLCMVSVVIVSWGLMLEIDSSVRNRLWVFLLGNLYSVIEFLCIIIVVISWVLVFCCNVVSVVGVVFIW